MSRTIAIGDIHGCATALAALIDTIDPDPSDTLVFLGDFIDRGPESRRVLDRVIDLAGRCRVVPILGNHEEMLLDALRDTANLAKWLKCGGAYTLRSYGWEMGGVRRRLEDWIPPHHRAFLSSCLQFFETDTHIFVHAGYIPDLPLSEQPPLALRWRVTDPQTTAPHVSGKIAVVGHTVQHSGEALDLGFLICIDTNCVRGGWLTALETGTGQIWQADNTGIIRTPELQNQPEL